MKKPTVRRALTVATRYRPGVLRAVWIAGSTEAQTIQCKYAPVLCSTENGLGQQNNLPWWVTPASAKTVPIPSPTKPVPIFNQPTVIPGPGMSPSPGNVVPVH